MFYLKQLLIIMLMLFSISALSQNNCQEDIDEANKLFDDGAFRQAEKLAKQTLETCDLNKTQENEMLKLLASIYYEMDELETGDGYVTEFLKKNPYYVASKKNDPVQFREAIKKLKSFPVFSLAIKAGVPLGQVTTKKVYPIYNKADYLQDYTIAPVFQGGMEFSWNISPVFSLNTGAGIRIQRILHQVPQYNQLYFNYEEQNISTNFPLSLGITIPFSGTFQAKILLGGELELFSGGQYSYFYTSNSNITQELSFYLNRKRNNVKINPDERNQLRYAAQGGIRFLYKLERFSIFADFRYIKELDLYNNPSKRFNDYDLFLANNYALSDLQLENLDISLGLVYNFSYKVKSKY